MDLARDEETRVRNLGRLALEKAAKAGASKAGSNGISRTFATVSRVNGDGTIDVSMGDYTDVNGVTSECILRGLRMTVACSSAQVGDRVIVDTYAHVSVVTGILANADNTHSVRLEVTKILSGFYVAAWKNANTVTIRWGNKSDFPFGGATEKWGVVLGHIPAEYAPKDGITAVGLMVTQYWNAGITNTVSIYTDGRISLSYKGGKPISCYGSATYAL